MKAKICLALALLLPAIGWSQVLSKKSDISEADRMAWWTEAKFGMFIHWGIYSVPAGFYQGKAQTNSAEWIMNKGKIPLAEYEKFAPQFNPTKFDARSFVQLAKTAGMKYMVITSKHHDGFSMFHSKSNPFNIVEATPFKRDILKELAAECQRQGIKFGFYYSQAQDWSHPGGMGNNWDNVMPRVSTDEYLRTKAIPEVRQLLTEYGPIAIFWWDTPRQMTKEVVDQLYHVTTDLQPGIITNDRLGEDYPGDHKTFERKIPAQAPDAKYWEVCMPISGSWGYRSDDKNFKSETELIRNLVDIASKGGNYLLNVSPTSEGTLLPEAVERLQAMGRWMDKNSGSIYGTQASPCLQPAWGRVTMKSPGTATATTLYLNVFDWSAKQPLLVQLKNQVKACYLLTDPQRTFKTETGEKGIHVILSGEAPDPVSSVVVLELTAAPVAIRLPDLAPNKEGIIELPASRAQYRSLDGPGAEYLPAKECIGNWTNETASVYWTLRVDRPGLFEITAELASLKESVVALSIGTQNNETAIPATGNYSKYAPVVLGAFQAKEAGEFTLTLKPVPGKWQPVNLRNLRLLPRKN